MIDEPGPGDLQPVREFPLKNGNYVVATRQPDYGFWKLSLKHGTLHPDFTGLYTSIEEVQKAVLRYATYRDVELGPQDPRPKIQFKPVKEAHA